MDSSVYSSSTGLSDLTGVLSPSLLDSATLSQPLTDNSAYLGLHRAFQTAAASDPLTSGLNQLASANALSATSQSQTTDSEHLMGTLFNQPSVFNSPSNLTSRFTPNHLAGVDPLTGSTQTPGDATTNSAFHSSVFNSPSNLTSRFTPNRLAEVDPLTGSTQATLAVNFLSPNPFTGGDATTNSASVLGDVNGDGLVTNQDLALILQARNTKASGANDPRDLNGDGKIDASDARKWVVLRNSAGTTSPVIQATLADDTAPGGGTNTDGITSDPSISGTITSSNRLYSFRAGLDTTPVDSFMDVGTTLGANGQFTLNRALLAQLNHGPLTDGAHTLHLEVEDVYGQVAYPIDFSFTLATKAPALQIDAPLADATHGGTVRLLGSVATTGLGLASIAEALDGGTFNSVSVNSSGRFDQALTGSTLNDGSHHLVLTVTDIAGNLTQKTVDFSVANSQFVIGPTSTAGWGATATDSVVLDDRNSSLVQTSLPIPLGQTQGARHLHFDLDAQWAPQDKTSVTPDQFLLYLVDPANPSQTLLDHGTPGTALFSLSRARADYTPGLVRFDGKHVDVDLTGLGSQTNGELRFQLTNGVNGTTAPGSVVHIQQLSSDVDPTGMASPVFPVQSDVVTAGPALNLPSLTPTSAIKLLTNKVHLDAATGRYTADLQLQNTGSAIGRQVAVVLTNLPTGVQVLNPSGVDAAGEPYINFHNAIQPGGLDSGAISDSVTVEFDNPQLLRLAIQPQVLVGPSSTAPVFSAIGPLNVMPGHRLEVPLTATDSDGDPVTFSLHSDGALPTTTLDGNGKLIIAPKPSEVGIYNFTLIASNGAQQTAQPVTLTVTPDPVTTTRISGVIENTSQAPLAGVTVAVGTTSTVTAADGSFQLEFTGALPDSKLQVHGEQASGAVYPFIAEKVALLLGHDLYSNVNNVISRPIYLPPLDTANAHTIDPSVDETITTTAIPGASAFVAAGTLKDKQGNPFTGKLSITEVPTNLTPAALPENLHPDLVVTIQPGDMVFTQPAPLSLPNRAGYAPGELMDLWSINPTTGFFDKVGTGQVSADGSVIHTISGGIHNSSWHFFAPPPRNPDQDPRNPKQDCPYCKASQPVNSEVELHSGTVTEDQDLVSYQSLGVTRSLRLHYDSMRADPRPIMHFGYDGYSLPPIGTYKLGASLSVIKGNFTYQAPGSTAGQYGLNSGMNFWSLNSPIIDGKIDAALQIDLRSLPSGKYVYAIDSGLYQFNGSQLFGSSTTIGGTTQANPNNSSAEQLLVVNSIDSPFGSGWGLAGWQQIVPNDDGSVLLIDGDGTQELYQAPTTPGGPYIPPDADVSTGASKLEKLADGTFRRTLNDQTVYQFNAQNQLASVTDRNGNATRYIYNAAGQLTQIVDPVGLVTTFTYTGNQISAITDPAGRTTQLSHDSNGNLTQITDPDSSHRNWQYDSDHHITVVTDQLGNSGEDFYDFAGRVNKAVRKDGSVVQVAPVEVQGLDRPGDTLVPTTAPFAANLGPTVASYADGNGNVTNTLLDQAGETVSAVDGGGPLPSVQRDSQNLVTQSVNARGQATNYTYDARGNVTSVQDELSGTTPTDSLFSHPIYRTGSAPQAMVAADLEGNGHLDLITANRYNSVSVFYGDGHGVFSGPINFTVENSPDAVAVGDLNGDGKLDIVTSGYDYGAGYGYGGSAVVSVLYGDGHGSFSSPVNLAVGNFPNAIAVGDLNGDGKLDIVTANYGSNSVSVLLNQGNGSFASSTGYTTGAAPSSLALGDVNGDGKLDIVTSDTGLSTDAVSVLLGQGDGSFAPHTEYIAGTGPTAEAPDNAHLTLADLNSDGKLDVVVAKTDDQSVAVLYGDGHGSFSNPVDFAVANSPDTVVVKDVNGDGKPDIVTTSAGSGYGGGGYVSVLLNNGNGSFGAEKDYAVGQGADALTLADVNGDGQPDIVTANANENSLSVLLGKGDGTFAPPPDAIGIEYSVGSNPQSVVLGDLNGDGNLDLVTANFGSGSVSVGLGNGNGTFTPNTDYALGQSPYAVALGDLNGDGKLDIITANRYNNSVSVLLGDGHGSFSSPVNYTVGQDPDAVAVGDLNGDGKLDLVVAEYGYGGGANVSVLYGNGQGSFSSPINYALGGSYPAAVALGDVNGDGKLDLVTANQYSNSVSVLFNNGNGSLGAEQDYSVGSNPDAVALKDVNGDGKLDIVTANRYGNSVSVLLGQDNGTFAPKTDYAVGQQPDAVALADVNGDGKIDIVAANQYDNSVSVLPGNGDGTFNSARQDFAVGSGPDALALGDLNFDGKLDLVTANSYASNVSVELNSTTQSKRSYTYDPVFNQLTSETDELGRKTLYQIDPLTGNQLSVTQVVGTGGSNDVVTRYTYTPHGQISTETDPLGRVTAYDYDAFGRLIKTTYALGTTDEAVQRFEYDAAGNMTASIDEKGNRTEYQYDAMNRLVEQIDADPDGAGPLTSPVTTYTYDAEGNQTSETDALGHVTQNQYDSMGRLTQTIDAMGGVTSYGYDAAGNQVLVVDPLGHQTQSVYDARNRLIETIKPDGSKEQALYDFDNNFTSTIDASGNRTGRIYDARGRLIREIDPLGNITSFEYDAANQLIAQIDANGHKTQYKYDDLGRQIAAIDPLGHTTTTTYDAVGNILSNTDALGHTTQTTYDHRNRQIGVTDANGHTTTTVYDADGNVVAVTDPDGNTTTYTYDALNRLTSETNALGATRSYSYDALGNRMAETDRDGRVRTFTYDALNRQTQEQWLGTTGTPIRTITSTYDADGELTAISDPDSTYHYTYDALGRHIAVDNGGTPGVPDVRLHYSYDEQGNVLSVTDTINGQAGGVNSYSYDALNRVTQITQSGNGVANKRVDLSYDAVGQMTNLTRYADLAGTQLVAGSSYTYDAAGRLTQLNHAKGATTLANYNFSYDAANRITQLTSADGISNYTYDNKDQLTSANYSYQSAEAYSYDANGNRTSSGAQTGTDNRLLSDGKYNYQYDGEGNLSQQTEIATGEVTHYTWDYRNRLTRVVTQDASGNITKEADYTYDVNDRRIAKSIDPDGAGPAPAQVERLVYDGNNITLSFDGSGTQTHRYLYGPRPDQILADEIPSGQVLWVLTDHLGTVRDLVDTTGTIKNHLSYDSFGNVIAQTNPAFATRYRFTGREFDQETGLYFYRERYDSPQLGRFLSEDPLSFASGDANLYAYVANQPVERVDPSGMTSFALSVLLTLSAPGSTNRQVYTGYPEADNYNQALARATSWFYVITIPETRNYGRGATFFNGTVGADLWSVYGQLKDYDLPQGRGQGTLRPSSSSPPHVPTIDLTQDFPWRRTHNTPGHEAVREVKFRYRDDEDNSNLQPCHRPALRPAHEPELNPDTIPVPVTVPAPAPTPTPAPASPSGLDKFLDIWRNFMRYYPWGPLS